jgi:beta-galactosidase
MTDVRWTRNARRTPPTARGSSLLFRRCNVPFGASCYHEYQPYERLEEDVRMMVEAGFSFVRVGDSIWIRCEPAEGRFDLDWLGRVLDAIHGADIEVVLTTPTYRHPAVAEPQAPCEVMARYGDGRRAYFGGRQNMDFSHPAYICGT